MEQTREADGVPEPTDEAWEGVAITGLICDMDGVLVDSEPLAERAVVIFLERHGRTPEPDIGGKLLGRRLPEAVELLAEWYDIPGPLEPLIEEFDATRTQLLYGNLRPMPGARELIGFARAAGLRLALATSNRRHQVDISLAETGLSGCFDFEVTGDDVARGKPEPDIFLQAASGIGVPPEHCLVLEDAPAGIMAATRAGMRSILIPNQHSRRATFTVAPYRACRDLFEVITYLRGQAVQSVENGVS